MACGQRDTRDWNKTDVGLGSAICGNRCRKGGVGLSEECAPARMMEEEECSPGGSPQQQTNQTKERCFLCYSTVQYSTVQYPGGWCQAVSIDKRGRDQVR